MSQLNQSRVLELIRSYGADPKRWPSAERQAGREWLDDNPALAQGLVADTNALDQALSSVNAPAEGTTFLQARILKAAANTAQDGVSNDIAANDTASTLLAAWKTIAATLVLTTGMGFGIGQVAMVNTSYASAEALLSISMQSGYAETDLYGDGV